MLAMDIWQEIPLDAKNATDAINQGILLALAYPRSAVTEACQEAAEKLLDTNTKQETGKKKSRKINANKFIRKKRK